MKGIDNMKNYKVQAIMKFTDKEENVKRNVGDEFETTKERYELLKSKNAVKLIGIQEDIDSIIKEEITEEEVQAVASAIVEEAQEQDKTIEEVVNEIVEESKEEVKSKPKKKKTSKK
jgi:hypothetical protein